MARFLMWVAFVAVVWFAAKSGILQKATRSLSDKVQEATRYEIAGQVFVVTEGRETHKLGDIYVALFKENTIQEFQNTLRRQVENPPAVARKSAAASELADLTAKIAAEENQFRVLDAHVSEKRSSLSERQDYVTKLDHWRVVNLNEKERKLAGLRSWYADKSAAAAESYQKRFATFQKYMTTHPFATREDLQKELNNCGSPNVPDAVKRSYLAEIEEVDDWWKEIENEYRAKMRQADDHSAPAQSELNTAQTEYEKANQGMRELKHRASSLQAEIASLDAEIAARKTLKPMEAVQELKSTYQVTRTDAEGAFKFTVDKAEKYAVFGLADRLVFDSREKYLWLGWVEPNPNSDKYTDCLLSNSNMMPNDNIDRLLHLDSLYTERKK